MHLLPVCLILIMEQGNNVKHKQKYQWRSVIFHVSLLGNMCSQNHASCTGSWPGRLSFLGNQQIFEISLNIMAHFLL